jgi:hypothetical protein
MERKGLNRRESLLDSVNTTGNTETRTGGRWKDGARQEDENARLTIGSTV